MTRMWARGYQHQHEHWPTAKCYTAIVHRACASLTSAAPAITSRACWPQAAAELERRIGCLNVFLRTHPVAPELEQRMLRYYKYRWERMSGVDQREALETSDLPPTLQREVALQINWGILQKVPT